MGSTIVRKHKNRNKKGKSYGKMEKGTNKLNRIRKFNRYVLTLTEACVNINTINIYEYTVKKALLKRYSKVRLMIGNEQLMTDISLKDRLVGQGISVSHC